MKTQEIYLRRNFGRQRAACGRRSAILIASDNADARVIMTNGRADGLPAVFYGQLTLPTWEITDTRKGASHRSRCSLETGQQTAMRRWWSGENLADVTMRHNGSLRHYVNYEDSVIWFLPQQGCIAQFLLSRGVWLGGWVSVTFVYCVETAKYVRSCMKCK